MSRQSRRYVFITTLIVAVGVLRLFVALDPVSEALRAFTLPVSQQLQGIVTSDTMDSDQRQVVDILLLEQQLAELRREANLKPSVYESVMADIVQRDVSSQRKSLWANAGRNDGVSEGNAVTSQGFLIGRVVDVGLDWSEIVVFGDPSFKVSAEVGDVNGIIISRQGSTLLSLVPSTQLGNEVIISDGVDALTPPNLPIGQISRPVGESDGIFQDYAIRLGVNPRLVDTVSIIKAQP